SVLPVWRLGKVYVQHALFELGRHLGLIDFGRQRKAAHEFPVPTLDLVERLAFLFFLELALALDSKNAVLVLDLHVFLLDLRKIGLDEILLLSLLDVDSRRPLRKRQVLVFEGPEWTIAEHAVQARLDPLQFAKWIPSHDVHMPPPARTSSNGRAEASSPNVA